MSRTNGDVVVGLSAGQSNGIATHGGLSPKSSEAPMIDNVVWGTDFRKGRDPVTDLTMLAADIIHEITIPYEPPTPHDTAPEMNCAGEKEPA